MGYPVHKFLEEFNADGAQLTEIVRALRPRPEPAQPDRSVIARVEEAYSRGYDEGRAAAQTDHAAELEALRTSYEERIQRTSALFSDALAERLSGELRRRIDEVHTAISDQLVSALLPVMRHVLTEASIRELAGDLSDLLNDADALAIELRGPSELIDRVTHRLSDADNPAMRSDMSRIKCVVDETAELSVIVNDTVIEARLMTWIKRLAAAVE